MQIRERDIERLMCLELKMPPWEFTKFVIPLLVTVLKHLLSFTVKPLPWCVSWERTSHSFSPVQRELDTSVARKCFALCRPSQSHVHSALAVRDVQVKFNIRCSEIHKHLFYDSHVGHTFSPLFPLDTVYCGENIPSPVLKCPELMVALQIPCLFVVLEIITLA